MTPNPPEVRDIHFKLSNEYIINDYNLILYCLPMALYLMCFILHCNNSVGNYCFNLMFTLILVLLLPSKNVLTSFSPSSL